MQRGRLPESGAQSIGWRAMEELLALKELLSKIEL